MQIVYLSARPAVLAETWRHVRVHMPWIDEALVVAPASMLGDFVLEGDVTLLSDEELSGATTADIEALDHTTRNTWLRHFLARHHAVHGVFLMSDDDYRPMRTVGEDFYVDPSGRHRLYFFYDLAHWPGESTTFDAAQHTTYELMRYLGAPHLAYGSHMPQIIDKELFGLAFAKAHAVHDEYLLCEWSVYANLSILGHPARFAHPEPFETMCWPQFIHEWPWWVKPARYAFENFYPEMYAPDGLFAGLPTDAITDPEESVRAGFVKVDRWTDFGRRTARFDFPRGIANPWTKGSRLRHAYFGVLRALRPFRRHLASEQRSSEAAMASRLAELEHRVGSSPADTSPPT